MALITSVILIACGGAEDWVRIAAETDEPAFALRLVEIIPNSQAESLGLREGDYVDLIGNHATYALPARHRLQDEPLFYCPAGGRRATVWVRPGLIGFHWVLSFRPQLDYLRGKIGTSSPRWDPVATTALALLERDPAVAEAHWGQARALGYPDDELHAFVRAYCHWKLGRPIPVEEAFQAVTRVFPVMPHHFAAFLEDMAHAAGRTDLLRQLHGLDPHSSLVPERWLANWALFDASPVPRRSLLELAERLRGPSLRDRLAIPPWETDTRLPGRLQLLLDHGFRSPDPGKFNQTKFVLPDGVRDFHCALSFRLATRGFHPTFDSVIRFEAFSDDATEGRYGTKHLAELTIIANRDGSTSILNRAGLSEGRRRLWLHDEPIPSDPEATATKPPLNSRPFRIDLVRLGREISVHANGVTYAHLPLDPEAPTKWLQLHVCGISMDIDAFEVWSLADRGNGTEETAGDRSTDATLPADGGKTGVE